LTQGADGDARLWDVATGKALGPLQGRGVTRVAVSPDGRVLAAGGRDGRVVLWEVPRPLAGPAAAVRPWVEVLTGRELDAEVAARLRGVTLAEPPDAAQAVVVAGPAPERSAVERLLHAGKHVLLAAEPGASWDDLEALWDAARRANVQLAVVNPDGYLPSHQ